MPSSYSNNEPCLETKSQNKPFLLEAALSGRLVTAVSSSLYTRCVETVGQGVVFSSLLIQYTDQKAKSALQRETFWDTKDNHKGNSLSGSKRNPRGSWKTP